MSEGKQKREPTNSIEVSQEKLGFILEPAKIEIGTGCAVSLNHDGEGNPIVEVKTYGKVDPAKLMKDIEHLYPNAKIRNLSQDSAVKIVKKCRSKNKAGKE